MPFLPFYVARQRGFDVANGVQFELPVIVGHIAVQSMLATAEASHLEVKTLFSLEQDLLNLADAIGLHYFPHGPNASRPEKLTGLA